MSFTHTAAFAIAAALAICAPAQAAPKLLDAISASDLAAMFNAHGLKASAHKDAKGHPYLDVAFPGKKHAPFVAQLHDCKSVGGTDECRIITYVAWWGTTNPVPLAKVNAYNAGWYYGKVFTRKRDTTGLKKWGFYVTNIVSLAGGVTSNHIGASLDLWTHVVESASRDIKPWTY